MIDYEPRKQTHLPGDKVCIVIGDHDVLMGARPVGGMVQAYFAPLPENHGLKFDEVNVVKPGPPPPEDAVAEVIFLNRKALDAFIEALSRARDIAFPK